MLAIQKIDNVHREMELSKNPTMLPIINIVTKIVSTNNTKTGNFITPFKNIKFFARCNIT